jgi:hypothetical protein
MSDYLLKQDVLNWLNEQYFPGMGEEAYNTAISKMQEKIESGDFDADRWISVKERLPENGQRVLVYYRNQIGETCDITETRYVAGGYIGFWGGGVTHWMPLPEPPEKEATTE